MKLMKRSRKSERTLNSCCEMVMTMGWNETQTVRCARDECENSKTETDYEDATLRAGRLMFWENEMRTSRQTQMLKADAFVALRHDVNSQEPHICVNVSIRWMTLVMLAEYR